jgi:hypothetical protein
MNKLLATVLATLFATGAFAAAHTGAPMSGAKPVEAMKAGDPKSEAAAQAKVDAKTKTGDKSAMQPEAMAQGSEKAQAKAEMKKKAKVGKKNSTDDQMKKDAAKL